VLIDPNLVRPAALLRASTTQAFTLLGDAVVLALRLAQMRLHRALGCREHAWHWGWQPHLR